jgi:hypothetical protein
MVIEVAFGAGISMARVRMLGPATPWIAVGVHVCIVGERWSELPSASVSCRERELLFLAVAMTDLRAI